MLRHDQLNSFNLILLCFLNDITFLSLHAIQLNFNFSNTFGFESLWLCFIRLKSNKKV